MQRSNKLARVKSKTAIFRKMKDTNNKGGHKSGKTAFNMEDVFVQGLV